MGETDLGLVDKIAKFCGVIIIGFSYFYIKDTYNIYNRIREVRPDFEAPSVWDLQKTLGWAVFFSTTKYFTKKICYKLVKPYCKDKDDEALNDARAWKAGKKLW